MKNILLMVGIFFGFLKLAPSYVKVEKNEDTKKCKNI